MVGGCPRSGTTALAEALNRSRSVSLLHEYAPDAFFASLEGLFSEEQRHRGYSEFGLYEHLLPLRQKHSVPIARAVFQAIFGQPVSIIGTKYPGHQYWPAPIMPPGIAWKEMMISRNPYDTVLSYVTKMVYDGQISQESDGWKLALVHWIHAWNHVVLNKGNPDFLNLMYDEMDGGNTAAANSIASFLDIECDFDLSALSTRPSRSIERAFSENGLDEALLAIQAICDYGHWLDVAYQDQSEGRLMGFKQAPEGIDFRTDGNSWMHIQRGFYPAEADGCWTQGHSALVTLSVESSAGAPMCLTLDIVWTVELPGEPTSLTVFIDNKELANLEITLGLDNGRGRQFELEVPFYISNGRGTQIEIKINNPRNPTRLGLSDDNRELGVMLRSLTFRKASST